MNSAEFMYLAANQYCTCRVRTQTNAPIILIGKGYLRICNKIKMIFSLYNTISCHEHQEKRGFSQVNTVKFTTFVCELNRQHDVLVERIYWLLGGFEYSITPTPHAYSQ